MVNETDAFFDWKKNNKNFEKNKKNLRQNKNRDVKRKEMNIELLADVQMGLKIIKFCDCDFRGQKLK